MEDRNRPHDRNRRGQGDRNRYRDDFHPPESRQAEQFDDAGWWEQDRARSPDSGNESRYFDTRSAERDWRDARPQMNRQGGSFGWPGDYSRRNGGFGDDYYDNGLSGYDRGEDRGPRRQREQEGGQRGFLERAGDQVASWFGDADAARRIDQDHRGKGPANYQRTDERILEDVCDRLTEDWQIDARNVQVTVNGGEVTLDGTVNDRGAKRRAEDIVEDVSGVGHVQNNLRVQPTDS